MSDELAGKRILIVDDDRDILEAMNIVLTDLGAETLKAGDGNTAVKLAEEEEPDLIVLDMMLPKRSGLLVMEKIRRGKEKDDPPRVIMITGNMGKRHKLYAESLGVDLYLYKPFRMEKLSEAVVNLLT